MVQSPSLQKAFPNLTETFSFLCFVSWFSVNLQDCLIHSRDKLDSFPTWFVQTVNKPVLFYFFKKLTAFVFA